MERLREFEVLWRDPRLGTASVATAPHGGAHQVCLPDRLLCDPLAKQVVDGDGAQAAVARALLGRAAFCILL